MKHILNGLDGGVLKIELNRPEKRNALTLDMYTEFAELLNTAQTKPEIRVVLVSAAGDNYSAGNDLQDFLDHPPGDGDSPQKQMIDAHEAYRIGLVNEVVPAADLISRCEAILRQMDANAPIAIRYAIDAVNEGVNTDLSSGLKLEAKYFTLAAGTDDKKEGTSAFVQKRAPQFQGK